MNELSSFTRTIYITLHYTFYDNLNNRSPSEMQETREISLLKLLRSRKSLRLLPDVIYTMLGLPVLAPVDNISTVACYTVKHHILTTSEHSDLFQSRLRKSRRSLGNRSIGKFWNLSSVRCCQVLLVQMGSSVLKMDGVNNGKREN